MLRYNILSDRLCRRVHSARLDDREEKCSRFIHPLQHIAWVWYNEINPFGTHHE